MLYRYIKQNISIKSSKIIDNQIKHGRVVGKPAPNFTLQDHDKNYVDLKKSIKVSSAMLVFYPENFSPVCPKQLWDYRDSIDAFLESGVPIFGVSKNDSYNHSHFAEEYDFLFTLLSDPSSKVARDSAAHQF